MVVNLESLHFCPITRVKLDAFFSPLPPQSRYIAVELDAGESFTMPAVTPFRPNASTG